jgi:hypothetical protein
VRFAAAFQAESPVLDKADRVNPEAFSEAYNYRNYNPLETGDQDIALTSRQLS